MAAIKGKDTRPEKSLRSELFALGLRYRLHVRALPGSPDLVFPRYRAVVFVHGCFWHRHSGCRYAAVPKSNADFWANKLSANVKRDEAVMLQLKAAGWYVAVVWECALRADAAAVASTLEGWLKRSSRGVIVIGEESTRGLKVAPRIGQGHFKRHGQCHRDQ